MAGKLVPGGRAGERDPERRSSRLLAGYCYVLGAVLAWSSLPVMARLAYQLGMTPLWLGFLRFGLALLVLGPACLLGGRTWLVLLAHDRSLLAGVAGQGLAFAAAALTALYALEMMAASLATILLYLAPAFTCLLAVVFLKERMTAGRLAALLVTLAGVAAVVGPRGPGGAPVSGVVLAVLSALLSATYFLLGQNNTERVHPLALATIMVALSAATFALACLLWARRVIPLTASSLALTAAVAFFPTVLGSVLDLLGIRSVGAARTAIITTLEPPIALILARAILGDRLLPLQVAGAVLVTGGVLILGIEDYLRGRPTLLRRPRAGGPGILGEYRG